MLFWVVGVQVKVMGGNPMWFPGLEAWINSFIKNEVLRWVGMPGQPHPPTMSGGRAL